MLSAFLLMVWMLCNFAAGWLLFKLIMFLAPHAASLPVTTILGSLLIAAGCFGLGMVVRR